MEIVVQHLSVQNFKFYFNYSCDEQFIRKFFTFVFTLNVVGIGFAASGHWPYAVEFSGAMVLGNLFFAILMRNELFGRFLYWFVNTFFAKWPPLWWRLGCTSVLQVRNLHAMTMTKA